MGSQLKKGQVSQSTRNRMEYSYLALNLFNLLVKANTNAKGMEKKTKKKLSKLDLCKFMAEHNKSFRQLWLNFHPGKSYPKQTKLYEGRTELGKQFYRSNVADSRRSGRLNALDKLFKKTYPGQKQELYYFRNGKKVKIKL